MSNSSLIDYKWTGTTNNYNTRDHAIDRLTIHMMAGKASLQTCFDWLAYHSGGSVNYGIDNDGKIGLMIDECNRAWTSNSRPNDMRAVTIEVSNSCSSEEGEKLGWPVSDKAMASLIKLCADICKRNGIKSLNYTGDKTCATGNMSLHKWFAATSCPGAYLEGKMTYIAQEVNKILNPAKPITNTTLLNYDQFQAKYLGKAVDYDGVAGVQCVDLADQYFKDCFGITGVWVNGARDFYNNFNSYPALVNAFNRVANTRDLVIQKGDVVIWGGGTWGHVAIGNGQGNIDYFVSLEENTTGRHEPTQLVTHYFNGKTATDGCNPVLGVLRPKDQARIQGNTTTYKTYYANDPSGVNYRATPNGALKGTYKYGEAVSVIVGSDTINNGLTWVQAKNGYWSAKNLLSTTKPVTASKEPYQTGKTYTLQTDMKVRKGATGAAPQLKTSELAAADKKYAYNQTYAVLKKGTKITLRGVVKLDSKEYWGKIASGYVCLKTASKTYVK